MSSYYSSFNYLGINSRSKNLVVAHFDADSGESETFLNIEPIYTDSASGVRRLDYGAKYGSVAIFRINVIKPDGNEFSVTEIRDCLKWLTGSISNSTLDLLIGDQIKYSFIGRITNVWQYKMDAKTVGLILEFTSSSPFAYSPKQHVSCSVSGTKTLQIHCPSDDLNSYVYMQTTYKNTSGTSLTIENITTEDKTEVKELATNEIITIDNNIMITSDKQGKTFGNTFNFCFPRLTSGINNLIITANGNITFEYSYPIKIGDLAIDTDELNGAIDCESGAGTGTVATEYVLWENILHKPPTISESSEDFYTKTEVDTILSRKIDDKVKATTYTKTEVDTLIDNSTSDLKNAVNPQIATQTTSATTGTAIMIRVTNGKWLKNSIIRLSIEADDTVINGKVQFGVTYESGDINNIAVPYANTQAIYITTDVPTRFSCYIPKNSVVGSGTVTFKAEYVGILEEIVNLYNSRENTKNKISDRKKITDDFANYPSINYLNEYYYDYSEVDDALSSKLDNSAGSVKTTNIASGAVTSDKIDGFAVTSDKIAYGAVGYPQLADNSINYEKLSDYAVHYENLQKGCIYLDNFSEKLLDSYNKREVTWNRVSDKSKITDSELNYPSINYLNNYYYDYSEVDEALSSKLDNTSGSVTTDNIANKAVTSDKIANGAITALKIATNAVSGNNIAQNQINTDHLQNGAVTTDKLADEVKESINSKADKATTLAGYGITDAYTKNEVDNVTSDLKNVINPQVSTDTFTATSGETLMMRLTDKKWAKNTIVRITVSADESVINGKVELGVTYPSGDVSDIAIPYVNETVTYVMTDEASRINCYIPKNSVVGNGEVILKAEYVGILEEIVNLYNSVYIDEQDLNNMLAEVLV